MPPKHPRCPGTWNRVAPRQWPAHPGLRRGATSGPETAPAPRKADHPLAVTLAVLRTDAPSQIARSPAAWPRWAVLLPHALAATSHLGQHPEPEVLQDASWLLDAAGSSGLWFTGGWMAGQAGDCIGLIISSWSSTQVVYGFGDEYANCAPIQSGNQARWMCRGAPTPAR